ncbi:TetR/AcrR family transcriptional regulator [Lactiplantibacillus paraplantarum]|uniref:TetR/AcrR family transcriptional regulator n=1 Tax=Lactiplantibacillus paraplantarum TaxID=60520 RepID=UPI0021A41F7C|nr:TetR/AcrR family transcriptional regulator [Lactiplantibacillus paraplantarum]MCT4456210.1 TetR/AcrR family transcriptional regulator [Lactiplantibacillus paraplantarum]
MAYTNKTTRTNQRLQSSLLKLMTTKPFEKITVADIVNDIHINRSTFYRHVDDKYELLDAIEQQILTDLDKIRAAQKRKHYQGHYFDDELALIEQHHDELSVLLGKHPSPTMSSRLETRFTNDFVAGLHQRSHDERRIKLIGALEGSVSLNMFKYLVLNTDADRYSPQEVADIMLQLGQFGPIQTLVNE